MGTPAANPKRTGPLERFSAEFDRHVNCAWCNSANTKISSPFGGTVSEIIFTCSDCGETFGWMKWENRRNTIEQETP